MRYKACRYKGKRMKYHVAIWIDTYGDVPVGMCIHHINGNKLDNRIENLMTITIREHSALHAKNRKRNKKGWFVK